MRTIPSFTLPPITVTAQEVLGVFCLDFAHTLRTPVETGEKGGGGGGQNPQKRALEEAVRCHQPKGCCHCRIPANGSFNKPVQFLYYTVSSNYKPTGSA